ncbi:MAG: ribosomal protein [Chlamydiales bacterium]|jgi:small subunit ribosomal protein S16|nr:ribosomal protein [Chlamydiales bacterium]
MALKIRMRKQGRHARPFYRLVVADVHSPRDGKHIENLGWYNPFERELERMLSVDAERLQFWLDQGAILTDKVEALIRKGAPAVLNAHNAKAQERKLKKIAERKERRARAKASA